MDTFDLNHVSEDSIVHKDGSPVCVGDRLECDGCCATLRYIGLVPPTKGTWLGVEWDDKDRGKHDGTHEGHTYFKTQHPKSGSFIRPKKANFGLTFMSAVRDRYGRVEDEHAGVIPEDLFVVSSKNVQTVVEMVGARKVNDLQSKIDGLREVALRQMHVYGTPVSHDLSLLVPSIEILDISSNLLPSWKHVADITRQLKNLKSLNVSENELTLPANSQDLVSSFSHVVALFLNRMGLTWQQITNHLYRVHIRIRNITMHFYIPPMIIEYSLLRLSDILQCCDMFSHLEQIHACFNSIQSLSSVEGRLCNIRLVNLESNQLTDWSQILHLSHLPELDTLIVSDNGIHKIYFDDNKSASTDMFLKLRSLTLNNNKISEWSSINELNKLACLEELRIKSNPLMESANPQTLRQLLIAKLKHLKMCNRTEVLLKERKGAEIDYLKRFGPEWVKSGGNQDINKNKPSPEFVCNHPRFNDLVQVRGAPEDSEMQQQSATLKSSLIIVKMTCPSLPDKKVMEKKIPETMTIGKLKALIYRLYKLDSEIQLSYISQKMAGQEIELDNDQQFLSYYSIEPGDIIQVKL